MIEPKCPKCASEYTYHDGNLWICPQCAHEWNLEANEVKAEPVTKNQPIRDVNGNVLQDGDSVTVIKDLKVKGASSTIKVGTKIKSIRLLDGHDAHDGHNIACKIDGIGSINLKSEFVRKA